MTISSAFNSVRALIDRAYVNCGLVAAGSQANSQQYADGLNRLNERVNFLQTKGLKLFTNVDVPMPLVAGTSVYVLGPLATVGIVMTKPLRIPFAYFVDVNGNKVPLTMISWQEISILQTANQTGQPVNYFVDKQRTQLNITLWPTPNTTAATGSVHLVLQAQAGQGVLLTDAISFPQEWFNGLAWDLADELATGQPSAIVVRCAMKAKEFLADLEGWDVEDAQTFLTIDSRMTYGSSNFA